MLVPPANFGIAEAGIYRCSKVETLNLSFLETLNLRTVLFIGGQEPSKFFREFFNKSSIEWCLIRIADFSSAGEPISKNINKHGNLESASDIESGEYVIKAHKSGTRSEAGDIKEVYHLTDSDDLMLIKSTCLRKTFQLLLNIEKHNVLLVDRTSIIVGILRKIQKWNIASIINEYRLFSGKNRSYFAETFLEVLEVMVEQEKDDMLLKGGMEKMSLATNTLPSSAEIKRKMSNIVIVSEEDLSRPPQIPSRVIKMLEEAEARSHKRTTSRPDSSHSHEIDRSLPSLGIFGHRYRLAFDKNERGEYKYYESQKTNGTEDALTLKIPKESLLPVWLKFQRDLWERENVPEEHNFYKEQIFI